MNRSGFSATLVLMVSSIVLLLILQGFWIQNSYERAFHDLQREANSLFRSTVVKIRDSVFFRNIEILTNDSVAGSFFPAPFHGDTMVTDARREDDHDEHRPMMTFFSVADSNTGEFIAFKKFVTRARHLRSEGRHIGFTPLAEDSTLADTVRREFAGTLQKNGLALPFVIRQAQYRRPEERGNDFFISSRSGTSFRNDEPRRRQAIYSDTLTTDFVGIHPANRYAASIAHIRSHLVAKITPQILFSLFLSVLTVAAFVVMYRSIRSQQRLVALKNDFISNVSHELQTPVATVSVALEALKNFKVMDNPSLTQEYLDIARLETERLSLLTDRILKTSIVENKGTSFTPEVLNVDEIIQQVITSMRLVFQKFRATVDYRKEGTHFEICGSAEHLTNVVYNLVDNALKYCQDDPHISIRLKNSPERITLIVKDNGVGIAPEYRKKIFEKFFRVPTGDRHTIKGYGLGLNFVAGVIKKHKGTIAVESKPHEGSCFVISIPRQPASQA